MASGHATIRPAAPARAIAPHGGGASPDAPLRLAFVGQETYFKATSLTSPAPGIVPRFVEFRAGGEAEQALEMLTAFSPDVVIAFRPEIFPAGLFHDLPAATLGFLTEPLPRGGDKPHPDLRGRLDQTRAIDPLNFDRIVSFDPLFVEAAAGIVPVWRSVPLPVDDSHFGRVEASAVPPRVLFVGRSTEHREWFLVPVKHVFDILHIAHGAQGEDLRELLLKTDVGINLHNEPYPSFENRVCLHLAAGNLVVSEPLSPTHGLEPGIDFLEVSHPDELLQVIDQIHHHPDLYRRVRIRGRRKAESFRASHVYPRLLHDLFLDLRVFGSERPGSGFA